MDVPRSDDQSREMVIFIKYFDSAFIVCILNHLYNIVFKYTPKSSFESPRKLLYLEYQFDRINDVRGAKVLS